MCTGFNRHKTGTVAIFWKHDIKLPDFIREGTVSCELLK
jgi:hypothetical protein